MMKKLLPVAACLVLMLGVVGCAAAPEASNDAAPLDAPLATTGVLAPELSADLLPYEGSEFDEGCLSCHESYDAVAEKTAEYGDSNPYDSIHGRMGSCQNCHEGEKIVNEDQKYLSCHAWPRDEQSMTH